jgi:excinuclease ABC subunit B
MPNTLFKLVSPYQPTGDQPQAIEQLVAGVRRNLKYQTLLGVTGSGKTFTMANVIARLQRPALIISHNKTLAAQLAAEFQQFFPENAVHYFVSYYDYYQPEAYIPASDTYIEKETQLNEEIDRLRHAATQAILSRRDTIIVASVSCIYGLGSPAEYASVRIRLKKLASFPRQQLLRKLTEIQYQRNDIDFHRGTFRVKGEIIEIFPADALDRYLRLRYNGDRIELIEEKEILTADTITSLNEFDIYPATHYLAPAGRFEKSLKEIEHDLAERLKFFEKNHKLLEAQRLKERTNFDLEMLRTVGYCNGIENYSRYFDGRQAGEPPYTLLDYLPKDALVFIDESHMSVPQIQGMYAGDRARKQTLIDFGFRLPAALDNRPLNFAEFTARLGQTIFVSATPADYEKKISQQIVEQLIRPTGLLDPIIEVKPTKHQVDDLLDEVRTRIQGKQRVLITTLTKRLAEDLADYLQDEGFKVSYIHSDIDTMERLEILRSLRLGQVDILVGINLLREGLDLPEVSLVAILDADKEGFLRSASALIQVMGRAARHADGKVIMYADKLTQAMRQAISETQRRRQAQSAYNKAHHIRPQTILKPVGASRLAGAKAMSDNIPLTKKLRLDKISKDELKHLLKDLQAQMDLAAQNLEFERAAQLRDQIKELEQLTLGVKSQRRRRRY